MKAELKSVEQLDENFPTIVIIAISLTNQNAEENIS
jgi:hypothetical protein